MYKILYAQKANDDLTEIFLYIKNELKNSTAAYKFLESFFSRTKTKLIFSIREFWVLFKRTVKEEILPN